MWQYKGRKKRTFTVPKKLQKVHIRLSPSGLLSLPNELLFRIFDNLELQNDRLCFALASKRVLQLAPCLKIKLPPSLKAMKELTSRFPWPFYADIVHKHMYFKPCLTCHTRRSTAREDWEWYLLEDIDDERDAFWLRVDRVMGWCRETRRSWLCPYCKY